MAIFTHVTLGTNNFDAAVTFYDAVLGALSIKESLIKQPHAAIDLGDQVESVNRMEISSL